MIYYKNIELDFESEPTQTVSFDITVNLTIKKQGKHIMTEISGLTHLHDPDTSSDRQLLSKLKKEVCHNNGHMREGENGVEFTINGDMTETLTKYLKDLGFKKINVTGIAVPKK